MIKVIKSFVLGNGKSRLKIDLHTLRKLGKIYGCNALYRDFTPDVLIATDPGISKEIQDSGYSKRHRFYTRKPQKESGAKRIELNYGFSSGPVALSYACHEEANLIYLIGFDFAGDNGLFNNVYANSPHYKKAGDKETYYGNWVTQCCTIMKQHRHKNFIRIIDENGFVPGQFTPVTNLSHIQINEFIKSINS